MKNLQKFKTVSQLNPQYSTKIGSIVKFILLTMSDSLSKSADSLTEGLLGITGELATELLLLFLPSLSFSTCFLKSLTISGRDEISKI